MKVLSEGKFIGYIPAYMSKEITKLIKAERVTEVIKKLGKKMEIYYD